MRPKCTIIFSYIVCYCMGDLVEAKVTSLWYPLVLQTSEGVLHLTIILAVSPVTHTLLIGCNPQPTPDHGTDTTNSNFNDVNLNN